MKARMAQAGLPNPAPSDASATGAPAPAPAEDATRSAGRGGIAIAGAKVSFIVFGFAQQLILPHLLGVDGYGELSRVLAVVGLINNVVVATSIQGVSRSLSSAPPDAVASAFARTLRIHALIAIVVSALFAAGAGVLADAIGASHVATPLRLSGAVVLLYGIYSPLVGSLNGRRRFLDQAGLDVLYGVLRLACIAGGAWLMVRAGGSGVTGAVGGFVLAAALIVPIAMTRSGIGRSGAGGPSAGDYLKFLLPLAAGQYFLNQLMQTDFMLLSRFVGQATEAAGLPVKESDRLMGVYRGVQLFAFLPYQMLISIAFVLFPLLARAQAEGDRAAVRRYTMTGVRIAFVLTGLMCGTIAALAPHVLRFAFPLEISEGGGAALRIAALGMGAFAILGIVSAALTSLKRELATMLLTGGTVVLVAGACMLAIPRAALGPAMLVSAATASAGALALAATLGGIYLRRVAGGFVAPMTLVRVVVATGVAVAVGSRLPWLGTLTVLGEAAAVALLYLGVLVISGELGKADLGMVRRSLGKKR
jgi:stage V sporulation protein B